MLRYKKIFKGTKVEAEKIFKLLLVILSISFSMNIVFFISLISKWENREYEVVVIGLQNEDQKVYTIAPLKDNINAAQAIALDKAKTFVSNYYSVSPSEMQMEMQWGDKGFIRSFASISVWNNFVKYVSSGRFDDLRKNNYSQVVQITNASMVENSPNTIRVSFEVIVLDDTNYEQSRKRASAILEFGFVEELPEYIAKQSWNNVGLYFSKFEAIGV